MQGLYRHQDDSEYKVWKSLTGKTITWFALCVKSKTKTTGETIVIDPLRWQYLIDFKAMILVEK